MSEHVDGKIKVEVPLEQWVEQIADRAAEAAAERVIKTHVGICAFAEEKGKEVLNRIAVLETTARFPAWLVVVLGGIATIIGVVEAIRALR